MLDIDEVVELNFKLPSLKIALTNDSFPLQAFGIAAVSDG